MSKFFKLSVLFGACFMIFGCSSDPLDHYKNTLPQADIQQYFTGPIQAWGLVQDWRGRVIQRFDVTMVGSWEGDIGKLEEKFTYYDGKTQNRTWTIKKLSDGTYEGTASDIIDKAVGKTQGSAIQWNYVMDLPVGETTYRIRFDDWMWMMNDGVLINRSYLKKFGITVSELTLFMKKEKPAPQTGAVNDPK